MAKHAWMGATQGMPAVMGRFAAELADVATVLDVGCGTGIYLARLAGTHSVVGLDASKERLDALPSRVGKLCGRAEALLPIMAPLSFDAVTALDAIEHFAKHDGRTVLDHMKRLAKRRVVLFTPCGPMPLGHEDPLLCHRSAWEPDELEDLGFRCDVWVDFDYGPGVGMHEALWATWDR